MDKKVQSRSAPVYRSPDIIRRIKATSLLWERHLKGMNNKEMPKKVGFQNRRMQQSWEKTSVE